MTKTLWPLSSDSWEREEIEAVLKTIVSGRLTMGPQVAAFERSFASYHQKRRAVMVNSGSSANLISIAALAQAGRFKPGDEAIVPAIAWSTTYSPLHFFGLKLRVVDVDLETLNVDTAQVIAAINGNTRLIVAVSILGTPAGLPELRSIARTHELTLFEDNCESLGAFTADGKQTGTYGDISSFSTFFSHHLNTIEGGVVLTDDDRLADYATCLRAHGWTRDLPIDSPMRTPGLPEFQSAYDFVMPGFNVRPTELTAAIGLAQLNRLAEMQLIRHDNARFFREAFRDDSRFILQASRFGAIPFGFTMICRDPEARSVVLERLKLVGIETRMITGGCFTMHRSASHYHYRSVGSLPNAVRAHTCGFFVGNHSHDLSEEIKTMREVLGSIR